MLLLVLIAVVGEVGKLLGAKWKELDEDEKKVRWPTLVLVHILTIVHCSPTSSKLPRTRRELNVKRKNSRLVLA